MTGKDIVLRINAITNKDEVEALGEVLDSVLGTYEDNVQLLAQYNQQLNETSANIKALNKAQQEQGGLSAKQQARYAELIKQERELKQGKSELQIVMKNQEKIMQSENGSMKQQSLILGQLRMLWRNLTDEQKAALPQLKTAIDGLDGSLKQADADIGNFQRNVGNYPGLMSQMGSSITSMAASISPALGSVAQGFAGIGAAANPLGGVIAVVGMALAGVTSTINAYNDAIAGSATLTYQLRDAMVDADAANDLLTRRMQDTSGWLIKLKGNFASLWGSIKVGFFRRLERDFAEIGTFFEKLPEVGIKGAFKAAAEASKAVKKSYETQEDEITKLITKINAKQKELDKLQEGSVVRLAEIEAKSAEELLKSRDKEKYSDEERLAAARRYEKLIKERTSILKQQAILERDIAVLEGERSDNTHEVNMAIEQSKAKLKQLEAQEAQALRSVAEVRGTIAKALEKEAKAVDPLEKALKELDDLVEAAENEVLPRLMQVAMPEVPEAPEDNRSPFAKFLGVSEEQLTTIKSQALSAAQQIYGSIEQMSKEATQRRLDDELQAIEDKTESEKAILKAKLDKGILNEKQYEKKITEIDEAAEARREEAKKEAFEKEKRWNIATALMNMALGVTKALTQLPSPAKWIEAALVTTTGLAQIATISAQKYARGGELHGASHAQGGIKGNIQGHNIELEGGEIVINKRSSAKYRKALSLINSENGWGVDFANTRGGGYKFARGGVLGSYNFSPAPVPQQESIKQAITESNERTEAMIAATNRRIDRLQVQVNISDIESASETKQVHISRATL